MTSPPSQTQSSNVPPTVLEGHSSEWVLRRGYLVAGIAGPIGGLNGLIAGVTRSGVGAAVGFGVVILVLAAGLIVIRRGFAKRQREISRGYTVDWGVAKNHPELWVLSFRTLKPVSAPNARPVN